MYVVLIGLCILVFSSFFQKSGSAKDKEGEGSGLMKEMEETMEGFLAELEDDNRKLIETIAAMKQEHNQTVSSLASRLDGVEKQLQEDRQDLKRLLIDRVEKLEALPAQSAALKEAQMAQAAMEPPAPVPLPVSDAPSIGSRYKELLQMHQEGKSVEYIAKKQGMNKGEVSLIIQLALQEEMKGVEK